MSDIYNNWEGYQYVNMNPIGPGTNVEIQGDGSNEFKFTPDHSGYYVFTVGRMYSNISGTCKVTMAYSTTETTSDTVKKTREVPVTKYKEVPKTRQVEKERRVTKSTHISLFEMFV